MDNYGTCVQCSLEAFNSSGLCYRHATAKMLWERAGEVFRATTNEGMRKAHDNFEILVISTFEAQEKLRSEMLAAHHCAGCSGTDNIKSVQV